MPMPTPTPPPVNFDTSEYRASVGPVSATALTAYQNGATGRGVGIGIVDTGIDAGTQEFPGRISPASTSTAGNGSTDDEDGHGTAVAFTAAGRRNDVGTHGIAFDATIIALRTDTPGSCATSDPDVDESGCSHSGTAIGSAIDVARNAGARVINISLGGSPPSNATVQAINRATAAGIVIVISAGNDGDQPEGANPDPFTSPANDPAVGRGLVIIAGSVGTTDVISRFSNRAGGSANFYLAAVGEQVRAPCENTSVCLWSGTSFSAPQIAGAVALLAQAFPTLSGAQIVDLLYRSARDAGASGVDATYGRGILDLRRAFQPVGTTSLAGSQTAISTARNGVLSPAMGDAATPAGVGAVILDGFNRAFAIDLAQTIARAGPVPRLTQALRFDRRNLSAGIGGAAIAMTIAPGRTTTQVEQLFLHQRDAFRARALAASVTGALGSRASFAIAASEGSDTLAARLAGRREPAFLVARDPAGGSGFDLDVLAAGAVRHRFGAWGITGAVDTGDVLTREFADTETRDGRTGWRRLPFNRLVLGVDRRFGALDAQLSYTRLDERATVLGARFADALGAPGAVSHFADLTLRYEAGDGWSLGGTMRQGWTRIGAGGAINGGGSLRTAGYAFDIGKAGLFDARDSFGLRIAQPLRVTHGGLDLSLAGEWDYAAGRAGGYRLQRLNLAPTGREIDVEWRYSRPFGPANADLNLFWRRDPGNFAALPDDLGVAARLALGF
uniref:S8 family peptidase n=2 Tax=unclassified Sphingomonas TaxID=196159 RepID=UPI000A3F62CB|nr:S8 family peptidase [Sphingomonas sp. CCH5-A5]